MLIITQGSRLLYWLVRTPVRTRYSITFLVMIGLVFGWYGIHRTLDVRHEFICSQFGCSTLEKSTNTVQAKIKELESSLAQLKNDYECDTSQGCSANTMLSSLCTLCIQNNMHIEYMNIAHNPHQHTEAIACSVSGNPDAILTCIVPIHKQLSHFGLVTLQISRKEDMLHMVSNWHMYTQEH